MEFWAGSKSWSVTRYKNVWQGNVSERSVSWSLSSLCTIKKKMAKAFSFFSPAVQRILVVHKARKHKKVLLSFLIKQPASQLKSGQFALPNYFSFQCKEVDIYRISLYNEKLWLNTLFKTFHCWYFIQSRFPPHYEMNTNCLVNPKRKRLQGKRP